MRSSEELSFIFFSIGTKMAIISFRVLLILLLTVVNYFHAQAENRAFFFGTTTENYTVLEGDTFTMVCQPRSTSSVNIRSLQHLIVRNGRLNGSSNEFGFDYNETFSSLTIKNVKREHASTYLCLFPEQSLVVNVMYSPSLVYPVCSSSYDDHTFFLDSLQERFYFVCISGRGDPPVSTAIYLNYGNKERMILNGTISGSNQSHVSLSYSSYLDSSFDNVTLKCIMTQHLINYPDLERSCSFGPLTLPTFSVSIHQSNYNSIKRKIIELTCTSNLSGVTLEWIDIPLDDWQYNICEVNGSLELKIFNFNTSIDQSLFVCSGYYGRRNISEFAVIDLLLYRDEQNEEGQELLSKLSLVVTGVALLTLFISSIAGVKVWCPSRARHRQGNQDISSSVSMNILDSGGLNTDQPNKKTMLLEDRRKELPKIPVDEEDSQNSGGSESNYYSTADAIVGKDPRIVTEKDISIIMNIKMGKIYKRWMGSINLANEAKKCVVLTTLTERVMKKKVIQWEAFLRKSLALPASNYLAKIEAISVQSNKLYIITEHFVCEDLHTVLSRDTKEKGDYYCCSSLSLPDVIKHVAGVLEGMDILKTFGFLHPGLTTKKILLTKGGLVKLYDFCLAGDASKIANLKKAQMDRVTLNEFPPEMLLLSEYTDSSDVWSTAVAIWEIMAAGNPPFPKEQEVKFGTDAISPSASWPDKYLQIKDKILFECWNHNATLRPSIHHLRGTFVAIFEKLITDSSYEIPIPTMYLPMRAPNQTQASYAPMEATDSTQTTYSERIYHVTK